MSLISDQLNSKIADMDQKQAEMTELASNLTSLLKALQLGGFQYEDAVNIVMTVLNSTEDDE